MSDEETVCPECGAGVVRFDNVIPLRCGLCGANLRRGVAVQTALPLEER